MGLNKIYFAINNVAQCMIRLTNFNTNNDLLKHVTYNKVFKVTLVTSKSQVLATGNVSGWDNSVDWMRF